MDNLKIFYAQQEIIYVSQLAISQLKKILSSEIKSNIKSKADHVNICLNKVSFKLYDIDINFSYPDIVYIELTYFASAKVDKRTANAIEAQKKHFDEHRYLRSSKIKPSVSKTFFFK